MSLTVGDELGAAVLELVADRLGSDASRVAAHSAVGAFTLLVARLPSFDGFIDRRELAAMIDATLEARRVGRTDLTRAARCATTRPGILRRVALSVAIVLALEVALEATAPPLARAS